MSSSATATLPDPMPTVRCSCLAPLQVPGGRPLKCTCSPTVAALRGWVAEFLMPPMTADQRAWCLAQLPPDLGGLDGVSDAYLARYVLDALQASVTS